HHSQAEAKPAYWTILHSPDDIRPGPAAEALAQQRIDAFAVTYAKAYPAAVRCLLDDRQALTVYLRFPAEHWHRIRHSNFIERTFGETRRRVKVIGRLPGETSCVSLVWAVLDRASRRWPRLPHRTPGTPPTQAPPPPPPHPPPQNPPTPQAGPPPHRRSRLTSTATEPAPRRPFTPLVGRHPLSDGVVLGRTVQRALQ